MLQFLFLKNNEFICTNDRIYCKIYMVFILFKDRSSYTIGVWI